MLIGLSNKSSSASYFLGGDLDPDRDLLLGGGDGEPLGDRRRRGGGDLVRLRRLGGGGGGDRVRLRRLGGGGGDLLGLRRRGGGERERVL